MGQLINASLLVLGTIAVITGYSFFNKEKKAGIIRVYLLISGFFAALWCYSFGLMGMYSDMNNIFLSRMFGLIAIDGYLLCLMILIANLIHFKKFILRTFIVIYLILAFWDIVLFSSLDNHYFVDFHETETIRPHFYGSYDARNGRYRNTLQSESRQREFEYRDEGYYADRQCFNWYERNVFRKRLCRLFIKAYSS